MYWVHNSNILLLVIYGVAQTPGTNMAQNSRDKTQLKVDKIQKLRNIEKGLTFNCDAEYSMS